MRRLLEENCENDCKNRELKGRRKTIENEIQMKNRKIGWYLKNKRERRKRNKKKSNVAEEMQEKKCRDQKNKKKKHTVTNETTTKKIMRRCNEEEHNMERERQNCQINNGDSSENDDKHKDTTRTLC